MPIYLNQDRLSDAPWDNWQNWLQEQPNGKKFFEDSQGRTKGFIICWWEEDKKPVYLKMVHHPYSRTRNGGCIAKWLKFDNRESEEDPCQYSRYKKALAVVKELRKAYGTDRIGLIYWIHPESHYSPIGKYQIIEDRGEFPTSPSH